MLFLRQPVDVRKQPQIVFQRVIKQVAGKLYIRESQHKLLLQLNTKKKYFLEIRTVEFKTIFQIKIEYNRKNMK